MSFSTPLTGDYLCSLTTSTNGGVKTKHLEHFSSTKWASLLAAKKGLHMLSNCKACQTNDLLFHSLFPLKSNRMKGGDPVTACEKEATNLRKKRKTVKPSKTTKPAKLIKWAIT